MAKYNFETNILRDSDHEYMEYGTSERKFVNQLRKLAESHPDEVTIVKDDGNYIYAHVPLNWFRAPKPPIKREFTEEQKAQMAERMRNIHKKNEHKGEDYYD